MSSRPDTRQAVTIRPHQGDPVLVILDSHGAASALVTALTDSSDASAELEGDVHELPMIEKATRNSVPGDVEEEMRHSFVRVLAGRRLLELRGLEADHDDRGDFWSATALWCFDRPAPTATTHLAPAVPAAVSKEG
jgi:hypothetical protein